MHAFCATWPRHSTGVERARQEFDVPGIAVAVVKDGKVVLAKGYGVRKLGDPAPVTAESLFRIASNTKAFTVAALAMLVDEGKLRWDDRVIDHMPGFQMYDPYVTREMTSARPAGTPQRAGAGRRRPDVLALHRSHAATRSSAASAF